MGAEDTTGSEAGAAADASAAEEPPKDPQLEAFDALYAAVKAEPTDFSKWVSLLSTTEKLVSPLPFVSSEITF